MNEDKKRKTIIIILCLIVILLLVHLILFIKATTPNQVNPIINNNTYIPSNNNTTNNKTNIETPKNTVTPENKEKEEHIVKDKEKETTNSNNNDNTGLKPSDPPNITYTCPDDYSLNGNKCTITIDADYVCPNGTHDYAYTNIPNGLYCINLSEGYDNDNDECPDGYGPLRLTSLGTPDTYQCFPLHEKIYVCPDDYIQIDNTCTKTIDATVN